VLARLIYQDLIATSAETRFGRSGSDPIQDLLRDFPQKEFRVIVAVSSSFEQTTTQYSTRFPDAAIYCFEPKSRSVHGEKKKGDSDRLALTESLGNWCTANQISHIDLLKIDTEGRDLEVIKSAGEMLNKIDILQCQAGANKYNRYHNSYSDVSEVLFDAGFYLYGIYHQSGEWTGGGYPVLRRFDPDFVNAALVGNLRGVACE
jgi:hypothetical protein